MRLLIGLLAGGIVFGMAWAAHVGKLDDTFGAILLTAILLLLAWAAFRLLDASKQLVKDAVRASERRPRAR